MAASIPTVKDLLELKKKKPLLCVPDDYATTTKSNKDESKKAFYIPIFLNGTKRRLKFRFSQQVNTGKAKAYQGNDNKKEGNSKKITVTFTKLDEESFERTVYNPQHYGTLIKNNTELLELFDILADEYKDLVYGKLKTTEGPWGYPAVVKDAKFVTFRQTEYKATKEILDEDRKIQDPAKKLINPETGKVKCEKAMYRITVPSNFNDKGSFTKLDLKTAKMPVKKHIPYIFDARQKVPGKLNEFQPAVYDNPETGVKEQLTIDNIGKFITSMSVLSGVIEIDNIIYSTAGFSLSIKFELLYVVPHKIIYRDSVPMDELDGMNDLMVDDNDEEKITPIKKVAVLQYEEGEQPFDEPVDTNPEEKDAVMPSLPAQQTPKTTNGHTDDNDDAADDNTEDNTEDTTDEPADNHVAEPAPVVEPAPVETKVAPPKPTTLKKPNTVLKHDKEEVAEPPAKPATKVAAKPATKPPTKPVKKA